MCLNNGIGFWKSRKHCWKKRKFPPFQTMYSRPPFLCSIKKTNMFGTGVTALKCTSRTINKHSNYDRSSSL